MFYSWSVSVPSELNLHPVHLSHVFTGPLPALLIMLFITLRYDLNYLLSQRSLLRFVEIFFGNVKRFLAKEEKNKGAIMTSLHSCSAFTRSDNINIWSENPNKFFKIYFLRQYHVPSRIKVLCLCVSSVELNLHPVYLCPAVLMLFITLRYLNYFLPQRTFLRLFEICFL